MEGLLLPNCRHNESISHHCDVIAYAALVIKATTHKETSNIFTEANESLIVTATHGYSHDRSVSFKFCPTEKDPTVVLKVPRYYGYNSQDLPH